MMLDTTHQRRITGTANSFRRINDEVVDRAGRNASSIDQRVTIICECAVSECADPIDVSLAEYRNIRSNRSRFIVRPEHVVASSDYIVDHNERFWTIEKTGIGRVLAEANDAMSPLSRDERMSLSHLSRAVRDARNRQRQYELAVNQYAELMRERLAMPTATIIGLTQALIDRPGLEADMRGVIIDAINEECRRLLDISRRPAHYAKDDETAAHAMHDDTERGCERDKFLTKSS